MEKKIVMLMVLFMVVTLNRASAQVAVFPTKLVAGLHGNAGFFCLTIAAESITWFINDTSLSELQHGGVTGEGNTLTLRNLSVEYNNTRIECKVDTSSGFATLLVQGSLSTVDSLHVDTIDNMIFINWTAPFTLNITLADPDITYCVDVVSSTSSATLHSECGINVTNFTCPLPPTSGCDNYDCFVTPVNVVGDGDTMKAHYSQDPDGPKITESSTLSVLPSSRFSFTLSAPVCHAELIFQDIVDDTDEILIVLRESELTIEGSTISFDPSVLRLNSIYRVTVETSNVFNPTVSSVLMISTHDIRSCSINLHADNFTVLVNFIEDSEATGALLNFIFINEDGVTVDFSKSICLAAYKANVSQGLTLPLSLLYPGQYMLYTYDIESNKTIMNGLQHQASSTIFMHGQGPSNPSPDHRNCSFSCAAGVISVTCSFLLKFQATAQINTLDSVNILHVNTSMDPHTPVTLQVTENGEYLVTILPVQDGEGIISSTMFSWTVMVINVPTTQRTTTGIDNSVTVTPGTIAGVVISLAVLAGVVIMIMASLKIACDRKKSQNLNKGGQGEGSELSNMQSLALSAIPNEEPQYNTVRDSPRSQFQTLSEGTHLAEDNTPSVHIYSQVNKPRPLADNFFHLPTALSPPSYDTAVSHFLPEKTSPEYGTEDMVQETSDATVSLPAASQNKGEGNSSFCSEPTPLGTDGGPTPSLPTPISLAGQNNSSATSHYLAVALDNPTNSAASVQDSEYAVAAGYISERGQNYAFVEAVKSSGNGNSFEISKGISDDVVYSEVIPQVSEEVENDMGEKVDSDERSSMWDTDEKSPLLGRDIVQSFKW